MKWIKRIVILLFLLIVFLWGVLFTSENTTEVSLNLLMVEFPAASISVWIAASFVLGCLMGMLSSILLVGRLKVINFRTKRKLGDSEKKLSQLNSTTLIDNNK